MSESTYDAPADSQADGPLADGPLADLVVVDLTRALAGPQAAMMLGDLGARVIKVESATGDDTRAWGPPWTGDPGPGDPHDSTYFMSANRNKESIVLDLKDDADRTVLERLVVRADVLLENFRTGVLDRLGLTVARLHELNPRLVIGSISGFGHDGPEAGRAGYDQIAQGEGGLMSVTGVDQPTKVGVPIADLLAGMNLAYGVVAALHERSRTGRGRVVRTSLLAGIVGVHAFQGTRWTLAGEVPGLSGSHHPAIAPYGIFATSTSPVQVAVGSEGLWQKFARAIGLDPGDERYVTNRLRVAHRDELVADIETAFATHPAEHWLDLLLDVGIPAGKVRSIDDVYEWEQTRSQGLVLDVDHPAYGTLRLAGSPIRFDDNAFSGGRSRHRPPPLLDEHGSAIRAWLDEG
ncbi:CoA transferase [Nocardioides agariphilus]|uniref:CoA transferase n=1 Tax=Nocardioides agariphilus TaxID=433664 RepID=A0A930YKS0_9ACTN|nr:CoA transferase [Nocardioides agariphilus]MBF4766334.1 CoA transferase [Nocardioides agariphilus]